MSKQFVHLHVHSEFSLLDGLSKIKGLVKKAKEFESPALALTDHGVMYGAIQFYKKAVEEGVKPIIGCEIYMSAEDRHEKKRKDAFHLTVWAKNLAGYQNLMKIVTIGQTEGFYYKPRVDFETLRKYGEGLMASSGCPAGLIQSQLRDESFEMAKETTSRFVEVFGEDNFYLELQRHDFATFAEAEVVPTKVREDLRKWAVEQKETEKKLLRLSKEMGLPVIATNDVHYVEAEDCVAQDAIVCIQTGKNIADVDRMRYVDTPTYYMKSPEVMSEIFMDLPEAIDNTVKLAEKVDLELTLGKWFFPKVDLPEGKTPGEVLKEMTYAGAKELYAEITPEIKERIDYELKVIEDKGYSPYFLIYADMTRFSRETHIYINTRGSAAGSLVSYCCGITTVDPIKYLLPFERFLNPWRPSLPDIDLDISDDRRDDMIQYLKDKYGEDKVAQICTFGTMQARASVRDVGRVMGLPYSVPDRIAKIIPQGSQGFPMFLDRALKESPELKNAYDTEDETRKLIDLAKKIEGNARHISVHAAGVVVAPTALTDFTPLQKEPGGGDKIITQYEMHAVEDMGMVKMDILGIRNLSIMANAIKIIEKLRNVSIDIYKIPIDDEKTYKMLAEGKTFGVFQMASPGMTRYLVELQPTRVEDLMIMVALYRPGPMANIPEYIGRKKGLRPVTYYHPKMESFLKPSYGVLVYQDDLLYTALELAGYNWDTVDKFRKAVGKKIPEEMAKQHVIFVDGCIEHTKMSRDEAEGLWQLFEPFQGYGFNKCVVGDTYIYHGENASRISVKDVYRKKLSETSFVWGMDGSNRLSKQRVKSVKKNGVKPILEVKLRSGRKLRVTNNHPLKVFGDWKEAGKLVLGERVAVARKLMTGKGIKISDAELELLGYLIAEGNLCHPSGLYLYGKDQEIIDDILKLANDLSLTIKVDKSKPTMSVYFGGGQKNELRLLCQKLEMLDKTATYKSIPGVIFEGSKEQISRFVAKMWVGDGCVDTKSLLTYYATSSEELVFDLQSLLLRLDVISTVHKKRFKYRGGYKDGFTLNISHQKDLMKFFESISPFMFGRKLDQIEEILNHPQILHKNQTNKLRISTIDTIPVEILGLVRKEMLEKGFSVKDMTVRTGLGERLFHFDKVKRGFTREVLSKINEVLRSEKIEAVIASDIYWDEVVEITPVGREMTYDLTLEGEHNFLANDIVVHNSHAASYGMVSYWTGYLKANYPVEYMTALLSAEANNTDKLVEAISECDRMGITILPPTINDSLTGFTVVETENGQAISFGLGAIKNVGEAAVEAILMERDKAKFTGLGDFCSRTDSRKVNKRVLESLIKAGAFDAFGNRASLIAGVEMIRDKAAQTQKKKEEGQESLFGGENNNPLKIEDKLPELPEWPLREKLKLEKELLGFYLSDNPVKGVMRKAESRVTHRINQLEPEYHVGQTVTLAGMISRVKMVFTKKNNDAMAFARLEDDTAGIDMVIFPKLFAETKELWVVDKPVLVKGKVDQREDALNLVVNEVEYVDVGTELSGEVKRVEIPRGTDKEVLMKISKLLKDNPGDDRVQVLVPNGGGPKIIDLPFGVAFTKDLEKQIQAMLA